METKTTTIKWIAIGLLILTLCGISYYIGNQNIEPKAGYEYIKSERLDSLENESIKNNYIMDSINGELKVMRTRIDGTEFLTDDEVEKIVKESYDELHNQTPVHIDSLFVNKYDSAFTARQLRYNR